jgi:hypothetical protein
MAQTSRPCDRCGIDVPRTKPTAPIKSLCDSCEAKCLIDDCPKRVYARQLCSAHYTRLQRHGDPLAPLSRHPNAGTCSVPGCGNPMRKRTWCAAHYSQWKRLGEVKPFGYTWNDEPDCLICGKPNGAFTSRQYCSAGCQQVASRHGGPPPNPTCASCGLTIDLLTAGKNGRRKKADTKLCRRCKYQSRTEATPGELARRDGPYCQICGCDVDLSAVFPDRMRPSVDHIVPRALGGDDSKSNNQLSHLLCNQRKGARSDFSLIAS